MISRDDVLDMLDCGFRSYKDIAEETGLTYSEIRKISEEYMKGNKIDDSTKQAVIEEAKNGASIAEIVDATGISKSSVRRIVTEYNNSCKACEIDPKSEEDITEELIAEKVIEPASGTVDSEMLPDAVLEAISKRINELNGYIRNYRDAIEEFSSQVDSLVAFRDRYGKTSD